MARFSLEGKMNNFYNRIAGQAAVEAAVNRFRERVTVDPELAHFFTRRDQRGLNVHQAAFLGLGMNAPQPYHAHPSAEPWRFDAVARHLVGALEDLSVPDELIEAVVEGIAPMASRIVSPLSSDAANAN
jgi:hemoglobin